ncbi:hypothetical protein [Gloeocapsopsis dulcis]
MNNPSHYGYTHVVVVPCDSTLVYIAGQLGKTNTATRLRPTLQRLGSPIN